MHEDWEKEAPLLKAINKKNPFTIPDNYFESFNSDIEAVLASERLKNVVTGDGFTVPDNYFHQLQAIVQNRILSDSVKKIGLRWISYVAAACLTIAISVVVFLNINNNSIENQLHTIPDTEIVQYLQLNTDASDTQIIIENLNSNPDFFDLNTDIPQEEIEQYINSTTL